MKKWAGILLVLFLANKSIAQKHSLDFGTIDWNVQFIDASTVDTLAKKLTQPYKTDLDKVRAIFSWITTHISYNVNIFNPRRPLNIIYDSDNADTGILWKSADEIVAE